jgi:hypothetical protein
MLLALLFSPPFSAWTWIASLDIIDVFHLGLPHLRSYHHIPYAFRVKVQCALQILLIQSIIDPSKITTCMHFCFSILGVYHFYHKSCKKPSRDSCPFVSIHGRGLGDITKKTYNWNTHIDFPKIFKNGTKSYSTSISIIASCTRTCSCKGIRSNNACIGG